MLEIKISNMQHCDNRNVTGHTNRMQRHVAKIFLFMRQIVVQREKIFKRRFVYLTIPAIICAERMNAMIKILARQLTLDLYNCDTSRLSGVDEIKSTLASVVGNEPRLSSEVIDEGHCSIIGAFAAGHIALHVYKELRYVAVDIFTCADSDEPEELAKAIRQYFRPEKIKSTFLKRGDFGLEREIKPKIKVRVAPLRKVKNAGARVVKKLVRRGKEDN